MGTAFFKGGVHPEHHKELTASLAIVTMPPPARVVIPLQQHIGVPCEPLVEEGYLVKAGEKIGDSKGFVSAPVHASISGKVTAVGPYNHPLGRPVNSITIKSDGMDRRYEGLKPPRSPDSFSADQVRNLVREAGIVGMGGAAFPAHVKLAPPLEKPVDLVIINGAECEPYLTADHRLMLERPAEIVTGLELIIKVLGADSGIIGIENNKPDALRVMHQHIEGSPNLSVASLPAKYPQGAEKMLIQAITGRKVPSGGLPMDVGVVVQNVATAVAVKRAVREGLPLYERIVTVTGEGVARPANLAVRVGTLVSDVLEACGGLKDTTFKLVVGGPMMGLSQITTDIPVTKGTSGILALTEEEIRITEPVACIKCAKCVDTCPVSLVPTFISQAAEHNLFPRAEKLHAADCIECGCCSYICPAGIPLTQWIRIAKAEIIERRKQG